MGRDQAAGVARIVQLVVVAEHRQIEGRDVRGRLVRLAGVVDEIVTGHDYPEGVSTLLANALTLVALLGDALKFDGKLTLQAKGAGPVTTVVADYKTPGGLRGWAGFSNDDYAKAVGDGVDPAREVPQLMGAGHLALTIDQGPDMELYQGIVALEGATLAECAQKYFDDSEQLPTAIKLTAGREEGGWRTGGLMIQHLPSDDGRAGESGSDDDWRTSAILMASARNDEMISTEISAEQVLFRLFHEDGVRVFDRVGLEVFCQCSRDKIGGVLDTFGPEELQDMVVDGAISVTCHFCNKSYVFDPPAAPAN